MQNRSGLELYAESLEKRLSATKELIAQTNWWISAQEDYGVVDLESEKQLREDVAMYQQWIERDKAYLHEVRRRLA